MIVFCSEFWSSALFGYPVFYFIDTNFLLSMGIWPGVSSMISAFKAVTNHQGYWLSLYGWSPLWLVWRQQLYYIQIATNFLVVWIQSVKLETRCTVILLLTKWVSALCLGHSDTICHGLLYKSGLHVTRSKVTVFQSIWLQINYYDL